MVLINFIATLLTATYSFLILYFILGWIKGKTYSSVSHDFSTMVSIILPVRNEEDNIVTMLEDIVAQNYPAHLYEIIVVDDSSDDNTLEKISHFQNRVFNLKVLKGDKNRPGKKQAIASAILESKGELIITTDADCRLGKNWLATFVSYYEGNNKPEMIIGPVSFHRQKTFFGKIQSLEFLSLAAITGASAQLDNPLMCNGANLAYKKASFFAVNGFEGNEQSPSGDDMLVLVKFKKSFPGKIKYLKSENAIVLTSAQKTIKDFASQRKRWVSKSRLYKDVFMVFTSWLILLFNLSILTLIALSFLNKGFAEILFVSFSLKLFIDFLFLFLTASLFNRKSLLWLYLPVQLMYIFYIPIIASAGLTGKFTWKGRIYK